MKTVPHRTPTRWSFGLPPGIRGRLFLLILLILMPLALLLGWTIYLRYDSLVEEQLRNELEVADGVATVFTTYVTGVREQLFTVGRAILTFSPYTTEKATQLLISSAEHFPAIRHICWVNTEGVVLASSSPDMVGSRVPSQPFFEEILAGRPWVLSDISLVRGEEVFFFIATSMRGDDGSLLGVVIAGVGPQEVGALNLISDRPTGGYIALFDQKCNLVFLSPGRSMDWKERQRWEASDPLLETVLETGKPESGVIELPALGGQWLSARVPIAGLGWTAAAGRSTEMAFAPLRRMIVREMAWGVVITLTAIALAYAMARTISRPLRFLEQEARRMGEEESPREITFEAPAEVERLGQTVTEMAGRLVQAKKAAEEASRAKSEFLANMSHELRTPLTVIMGSLEVLKPSISDPEGRQLVGFAESSAHRLLGIIDDLLDISRIEAGRIQVELSPFDLRESVRQTVEMLRPRAQEKGLNLEWEVDNSVPSLLMGDADRLGQVLLNLVGNAVKFTDQGWIKVTVGIQNDEMVFTVQDTGIGIPADQIERLFQPFTQVDSSMTRRYGGTGLGLAISRELLALMGGRIWVEGRQGGGSTFTFTLPLQAVDLSTTASSADQTSIREGLGGLTGRPLKVLLAEDEPMVMDVIKQMLHRPQIEVILAENGRQAVECWKSGKFNLILMDLQMPELDGLEATRQIRALEGEQRGRTRIVALTAHVRQEDRDQCQAAGMDGFLAKPVDPAQLDREIEKCA